MLIPFPGARAPEVVVTKQTDPSASACGRVSLRWEDGSSDTVLWTPRLEAAIGDAGDVRTDAALVHLSAVADGGGVSALVYEGTYLDPLLPPDRESRGTFAIPAGLLPDAPR